MGIFTDDFTDKPLSQLDRIEKIVGQIETTVKDLNNQLKVKIPLILFAVKDKTFEEPKQAKKAKKK